jgi:altronate dehydratase
VKSVLVISDRDNVATALVALEAGARLELQGRPVIVRDPIPAGHKVAIAAIAAGEPVIKYGSPIGVASADIEPGTHVHTHNVASNRGRGDLASSDASSAQRLAEPAGDAGMSLSDAEQLPASGTKRV